MAGQRAIHMPPNGTRTSSSAGLKTRTAATAPKSMNTSSLINRMRVTALVAVLPLACITSAHAFSLDFTLPNADLTAGGGDAAILDYYNGGTDGFGSTGPNFGVSFGADALALGQYANFPGFSNTGDEPGGGNALFFLNGTEDTMDVSAGFTTGFSFYYDCPSSLSGSIEIWSGLDSTGTLLASLNLPGTGLNGSEPFFGLWTPIGVTFSGTAESVDFAGTANEITFADITIGSGTVQIGNGVPDTAGISLYALAGVGLVVMRFLSRKKASASA
jgi:hypothetical protein